MSRRRALPTPYDREAAYWDLADELNDFDVAPYNEDDWQPEAVAWARQHAAENDLPYPPPPGFLDDNYGVPRLYPRPVSS